MEELATGVLHGELEEDAGKTWKTWKRESGDGEKGEGG